jgi:uncharacterized protein YecE (DUF72 family)
VTRFWVGTSGWHYTHWRGDFYPRQLPADAWLGYYSQQFSTVELNNSFYHLPSDAAWRGWRDTVPGRFRFAVKASRYITHTRRLQVESDSISRFHEGAGLLGDRLGPILYQLPPAFLHTPENVERLERFIELLPAGQTPVFEFRHESWFIEPVLELLQSHGAAFCSFDMPGTTCPLRVTGGVLYIRFHGAGTRYGGDYSLALLNAWAKRIHKVAGSAHDAYIYFNNDVGGFAPRNALALAEMLGAQDVPGPFAHAAALR